MKYYQNKETGEIIGVENLRELITHPDSKSFELGFKGYKRMSIYDAIYPNKCLGLGQVSFCISASFLSKKYKRISKGVALAKYPEFKQYRHADMVIEAKKLGVEGIDVLMKQTI